MSARNRNEKAKIISVNYFSGDNSNRDSVVLPTLISKSHLLADSFHFYCRDAGDFLVFNQYH